VFFSRSRGIASNVDATASTPIPREAREPREALTECFAAARGGGQPISEANGIIWHHWPPT